MRDEPMPVVEPVEPAQPVRRERDTQVMPSRVIQISQAEELTEDDIRSALEVFAEIRLPWLPVIDRGQVTGRIR